MSVGQTARSWVKNRTRVSRGRLGPAVGNLIGSEQKGKALEDISHPGHSQDADSVMEARLIDGSELGNVYDAGAWKSCFTLP
jgi:hypothetical protein